MKTYDVVDKSGRVFAFEVSNSGLGRRGLCRVVATVAGAVITKRPLFLSWYREEYFCRFEIDGDEYAANEPYGDNSRYWIGPQPPRWLPQTDRLRDAFARFKKPCLWS